MEMQEMEITIDNEGQIQVKVEGLKGSSCLAVSRGLEEKVGIVTERSFTPAYYETQETVPGHCVITRR